MEFSKLALKAFRHPRKAAYLASYSALSIVGHRDFVRFIVLARSRTGSNLVISSLNSHPQVRCDGEILNKLNGRRFEKVLSHTFGKQPSFIRARGFKIFYYHPQDDPTCRLWDTLESMRDLHVIHLKRTNILRTIISRKIAARKGAWTSLSEQRHKQVGKAQLKVTFTVQELREGFQQTRSWEENWDERFKHHAHLNISYEDITQRRAEQFQAMFSFLGVSPRETVSDLQRQNPQDMRSLVDNYDELKIAFADTKWARFFED